LKDIKPKEHLKLAMKPYGQCTLWWAALLSLKAEIPCYVLQYYIPEIAALVTEYALIIDGADFLSCILSGCFAKYPLLSDITKSGKLNQGGSVHWLTR
jgi:hypothetical protein